MDMKLFNNKTDINEIRNYFNNIKKPFIIRNAVKSKIDGSYLNNYFGDQNITFLNDQSEKENLKFSDFIQKINSGSKYRLRANTKIGNLIVDHIDTKYIQQIRN